MVTAVFAAVTSRSCPFEPASPTQAFALTVPGTDALLCGAGSGLCASTRRQGPSVSGAGGGGSSQCDLRFAMSARTHPSPRCCRAEDLEHIYNQLRAIKARGMARLLDRVHSSYFPAFQAMCRDVVAGEDTRVFSSTRWRRISRLVLNYLLPLRFSGL